jgi:hypothetical protein
MLQRHDLLHKQDRNALGQWQKQPTGATVAGPPQAQHKVERGLFLNIVVCQCPAILQLLACKYEALLVWWDALFVLQQVPIHSLGLSPDMQVLIHNPSHPQPFFTLQGVSMQHLHISEFT